jgi:PKD repeat protein
MQYFLNQIELDYNLSFTDLEFNPSNASKIQGFANDTSLGKNGNYLFIGEDFSFNPNPHYPDYYYLWDEYIFNPILEKYQNRTLVYSFFNLLKSEKQWLEMLIWSYYPGFKGIILYDFNNNTYDMTYRTYFALPTFYINKTEGLAIENDHHHYLVNYSFDQEWNDTVESYNVIGQINGTDPNTNKYILCGCLYDGWNNQASADSAVGIGIMLAIAKYFKENNITPMYTMKFVAFSGEEAGCRGAYSYAKQHIFDNIPIVIDLNQFAYIQSDPHQALWVFVNDPGLNITVKAIVDDTNFPEWVNDETDLKTLFTATKPYISDHDPFYAFGQHRIISFMKENASLPLYTWMLHHRDGLNHTQGDCLSNINWAEVNATAMVILNVTKYLSIASNCWFEDEPSVNLLDSSEDQNTEADAVNISFHVQTGRPHDYVKIRAVLRSLDHPVLGRYTNTISYTSTLDGIEGSLVVSLPKRAPAGVYNLSVFLYNLTGEIDNVLDNRYDKGCSANDSFYVDILELSPPIDSPETPHQPWGDSTVFSNESHSYSSHTTDPNGDLLWYQWKIEKDLGLGRFTLYTRWFMGGPRESGVNISKSIQWPFAGTYNVSVRAKNMILNPNVMSAWSPAKQVTVYQSDNAAPWNADLLGVFSDSMVAVDQQTRCNGYATGVIMQNTQKASLNWTWDFGDSSIAYGENVSHSYSRKGNYDVNLMLRNPEGRTSNYTTMISVDVLRASFNDSGDGQPDETVFFTDVSHGVYQLVNWSWDFGDGAVSYERNTSHVFAETGEYNVTLMVQDSEDNIHEYSKLVHIESVAPDFISVLDDPDPVGYGNNVTIYMDFFDNQSGVESVMINITNPDNTTSGNFTMEQNMSSEHDYLYVFNDTWQNGVYNYSIWVVDQANNSNCTGGFNFTVSAEATISIATLQDSYSGNQYINITDPPNPPENYTLVDRGSTWDSYYDAVTGENILEVAAGPINYHENGIWTPINNTINQLAENHPAFVYGYRSGNNRGLYGAYFKSNAQQEWPVAFTYNKSDDPTIHAVRSKLVGVGYVDPQSNWAYQYLQNVQSSQGQVSDYSITYPNVFTGTDVTWSYGNTGLKEEITLSNTTKTLLQNHPPSQNGLNDASSYLVFITKIDYQNLNLYDDSGMLTGNVTVSDTGVDLKDALGQFKCALPLGEAYELNNHSVRQQLTYRIIHLNGDTYLLSGLKISDLNAMTFPVVIDPTLSVNSHHNDGFISNSSTTYNTAWGATSGTIDSSSQYLTIGQKKAGFPISTYYIYRGFVLFNTTALPSNAYLDSAILSLYKKDDYSTTDFAITVQNGQPTYPHNPLQTGDYDKGHYSGNGGNLNTVNFVNGRNNISVTELGWINETGWTKFCLRSSRDISGTAPTSNEYVNVYSTDAPLQTYVPKLIITYRNQSKIKNTGDTDIQGYLLIQVQFYNSTQGKWLVDNDTINETTARTITSGNQLALDTIFNGHVRASDLTHGAGTYRVYAAFRNPEGNILRTDDDIYLEAWWQFNKT